MIRRSLCAAALLVGTSLPVMAQGIAGPYLAARQAATAHDFQAASQYYSRALGHDPSSFAHMENAMSAYLALADFDAANVLAGRMLEGGSNSQIAYMVELAALAEGGQFQQIVETLAGGIRIGALVDGLIAGWSHLGAGQIEQGLALFDQAAAKPGLRDFALYHKALALGLLQDIDGAEAILSGAAEGPVTPTRRGLIAHVQLLSALGENEAARAEITRVMGTQLDARFTDLDARLAVGETLQLTLVEAPEHGIAEVYYTIAAALQGETTDSYALLYARLAERLDPRNVDAVLLSGDYLEALGRYDLAEGTYDRVDRNAPQYITASLGRADALRQAERPDAAVEVLRQLAKTYPARPSVHIKLGDTLRRQERYSEAQQAYDRGLQLMQEVGRAQWFTYFARGITFERTDNWDAAEQDFRMALELNPGQPQVLNYLGYSLVEKNQKLDEALMMIEQAVQAQPDSGHIMDSLGWVLYRLGRFEDAVAPMETAVELMATDPTINDHLGDVYWSVGRQTEARFQWTRALSFDPEEDVALRIRKKLEVGLDVVLKEEGETPIAVAQDG